MREQESAWQSVKKSFCRNFGATCGTYGMFPPALARLQGLRPYAQQSKQPNEIIIGVVCRALGGRPGQALTRACTKVASDVALYLNRL
jgi:hypothetical protein